GDTEGSGAVALTHNHVEGGTGGVIDVGTDDGFHGEAVGAADDLVHGLLGALVVHQEVTAHVGALLGIHAHGHGVILLGDVHIKAIGALIGHHSVVVGIGLHGLQDLDLLVQVSLGVSQLLLEGVRQSVVGVDQLVDLGLL